MDERAELQSAINNGGLIQLEGRTYQVSSPGLVVPAGTEIRGVRGCTVLQAVGSGWGGGMLTVAGSVGAATHLASADSGGWHEGGAVTLTADNSVFAAGDLVEVVTVTGFTAHFAQHARAELVDGSALTFGEVIGIPLQNVTTLLTKLDTCKNVFISGVALNGGNIAECAGLYASITEGCEFDISAVNCRGGALNTWSNVRNTYRVDAFSCGAIDVASVALVRETNSILTANLRRNIGFGLTVGGCYGLSCNGLRILYSVNGRSMRVTGTVWSNFHDAIISRGRSTGLYVAASARLNFSKFNLARNSFGENSFGVVVTESNNCRFDDLTSFGHPMDVAIDGGGSGCSHIAFRNRKSGSFSDGGWQTIDN